MHSLAKFLGTVLGLLWERLSVRLRFGTGLAKFLFRVFVKLDPRYFSRLDRVLDSPIGYMA
jgi:hypothetical protein